MSVGINSESAVALNNLWMLNMATNEWTWMAGSATPSEFDTLTPVGTIGVPSPSNTPGARIGAATWSDHDGNLWLFSGAIQLNDLWKFAPSTNEWAWMGGNNQEVYSRGGGPGENPPCIERGVYGTQGVAAPGNLPGSRNGSTTWTDRQGNFWLYGGVGMDSTGYSSGYLNNLSKSAIHDGMDLGCGQYHCGLPIPAVLQNAARVWHDGRAECGKHSCRQRREPWMDGPLSQLQLSAATIHGDSANPLWKFHPAGATQPVAATPTFNVAAGTSDASAKR